LKNNKKSLLFVGLVFRNTALINIQEYREPDTPGMNWKTLLISAKEADDLTGMNPDRTHNLKQELVRGFGFQPDYEIVLI
jgi:hypothetical protein